MFYVGWDDFNNCFLFILGDFERPAKPQFSTAERPKPIKYDDNLKPEGEFYSPEKSTFKPGERPTAKRPTDNLRPEGEFYSPEKTQFKSVERPKQVKPNDNLKQEGSMNVSKKAEYGVYKTDDIKRTDVTQSRTKTAKSHIVLGDDSSIMRTTTQINYNTAAANKKTLDTEVIEKTDLKEKEIRRDGAIMITTKKVTTVLASDDAKKAAQVTRKNVSSISFNDASNEGTINDNTSSSIQKQRVINGLMEHREISESIEKNVKSTTNIQKSSSTTQQASVVNKQLSSRVESDVTHVSGGQSKTTDSINNDRQIIQKSDQLTERSINSRGNNMTSLISHDITQTGNNNITGTAVGAQKSDMTSIIAHGESKSSSIVNTTQHSSSRNTIDESHHRKSTFSSAEQMSNSILTRQAQDRQTTNESLYSKGVSITGAQQRKSISNLHETSPQFSSDRKSHSYMYRTGANRDSTDYHSSECLLHQQQQKQSHSKSTTSTSTHKMDGSINTSSSFILHEGRPDAINRRTSLNTEQISTNRGQSTSKGGIIRENQYRTSSGGYSDSYSTTTQKIISGQQSEIKQSSQQIISSPAAGMSSRALASTTNRIIGYSPSTEYSASNQHSSTSKSSSGSQQMLNSPYTGMSTKEIHSINSKATGSSHTASSTQYSSSSKTVSQSSDNRCGLHQIVSSPTAGISSKDLHSTTNKFYNTSSSNTSSTNQSSQNKYLSSTSSAAIKNRQTTSNISFGDSSSGSNFSSAYKSEYVKTHYKPCPASNIDKNHLKQTRTTKSHKFFLTEE